MSEKFGFPVFTVGMLVITCVVRLLEVNGMLWFDVPWIRLIMILTGVLVIGAIIFGRDKNRPVFALGSAPLTSSVRSDTGGGATSL